MKNVFNFTKCTNFDKIKRKQKWYESNIYTSINLGLLNEITSDKLLEQLELETQIAYNNLITT